MAQQNLVGVSALGLPIAGFCRHATMGMSSAGKLRKQWQSADVICFNNVKCTHCTSAAYTQHQHLSSDLYLDGDDVRRLLLDAQLLLHLARLL